MAGLLGSRLQAAHEPPTLGSTKEASNLKPVDSWLHPAEGRFMKILVIGGTGNISRAIVTLAGRVGHEVSVFTRGKNRDAVPEGVRHIQGDRRDRAEFEAKVRRERFDAVFDMISFSKEDAASAVSAFSGRVGHFVHCSTVMTYGPPFARSGIQVDEDAPLSGNSPYGLGKIEADTLLLEAHRKEQFPVTIFKPSYTHGPGNPLYRQVGGTSHWLTRLKLGKPILSAGDGLGLFQFLASKDAAVGFLGVLGRSECLGQIYNIVHPEAKTWDDWHRATAEAMGQTAKIVHVPQDTLLAIDRERFGSLPANFGHHQVFSHHKLERVVPEFAPKTPLVESLREVILWMELHDLIERDESDLEDRIIETVLALPSSLAPG